MNKKKYAADISIYLFTSSKLFLNKKKNNDSKNNCLRKNYFIKKITGNLDNNNNHNNTNKTSNHANNNFNKHMNANKRISAASIDQNIEIISQTTNDTYKNVSYTILIYFFIKRFLKRLTSLFHNQRLFIT